MGESSMKKSKQVIATILALVIVMSLLPMGTVMAASNDTAAYSISLNRSGTHTFAARAYGVAPPLALSVTARNTGSQPTGSLTVTLGGANPGSFTLESGTAIEIDGSWPALGRNATRNFTVRPKSGLPVNYDEDGNVIAYTATVTVSGNNDKFWAAFNVSFTVNPITGARVNANPSAGTNDGDITRTSITVRELTAGNQTVEYAISTSNSTTAAAIAELDWQDGRMFGCNDECIHDNCVPLTPFTQYFVFARSKATNTHGAGAVRRSSAIRTHAEDQSVILNRSGTHIFAARAFRAAPPNALSVSVRNNGHAKTDAIGLVVTLDERIPNSFTLSRDANTNEKEIKKLPDIRENRTTSFNVRPKADLDVGVYYATVIVHAPSCDCDTDYECAKDNDCVLKRVSFDVSYTVGRAAGARLSANPRAESNDGVTKTSITAASLTVTGQTVEYAISTSNSTSAAAIAKLDWQDERKFGCDEDHPHVTCNPLTPFTQYFLFARSMQTENLNAGAARRSVAIRTLSDPNSLIMNRGPLHEFAPRVHRASPPNAVTVTVTYFGDLRAQTLRTSSGELNVTLTGNDETAFTLGGTTPQNRTINSINSGRTGTFTVRPVPELNARDEAYKTTVEVSGTGIDPVSIDVSFKVNKANGAAVNRVPSRTAVTADSITVGEVLPAARNPGAQTLEYAISTSTTAPRDPQAWRSETSPGINIGNEAVTFYGLDPFTQYFVFARTAENNNYNAGAVRRSAGIRTLGATDAISLNRTGLHTFATRTFGAAPPAPLSVTVSNIGSSGRSTGPLTVELVCNQIPQCEQQPQPCPCLKNFELVSGSPFGADGVPDSWPEIAGNSSRSFTVAPITGLGAGTHTATVKVSGAGFPAREFDVRYTVNRAAGAAVNVVPTVKERTHNSITVNEVRNATSNGQVVEYAISTSTATPVRGWQSGVNNIGIGSNVLTLDFTVDANGTRLTPSTQYFVFARTAADPNYNSGAVRRSSTMIQTKPLPAVEIITSELTCPKFLAAVRSLIKIPNGNIFASDVELITRLVVSGRGITNLEGIEHFKALDLLDVSENELVSLDVSKNPRLKTLRAQDNKLTSLALRPNDPLYEYIDVRRNDLPNINAITGGDDIKWDTGSFFFTPQSKMSQTITFISSTQTIEFGKSDTFAVVNEGSGTGNITYSSGNTSVATVHETSGAITTVGVGQAVITATKAGCTNYTEAKATYTLTVTKAATGLNAAMPGNIYITSGNTLQNTYDLEANLHPAAVNPGAPARNIEFKLGFFDNQATGTNNILTAAPTLQSDGKTIHFTGTGQTTGTATLIITISSDNYADITRTLTFAATDKTMVDIGGLSISDTIFSAGTAHMGYTGAATFTTSPGGQPANLTNTTLTVLYTGTANDSTSYNAETPPTNAGNYDVKVELADDPAYVGSWTGSFIINRAVGAAVSAAPAQSGTPTYNSITVNTVTAVTTPVNTGQTVQYAIDTTNNAVPTNWQPGTIFGNLPPNTEHFVYARTAQSHNYDAGAVQVSAGITTMGLPAPIISDFTVTNNTHTFDGEPKAATVQYTYTEILTPTTAGAITVYYEGSGSPAYARSTIAPTNAGTYNVLVTTAGGSQFNAITTPLEVGSLTISKAAGAAVGVPTVSGTTPNSIAVNDVTVTGTNPAAQTVEYNISLQNNGSGLGTWQSGRTFYGLTQNTDYFVYARSADNANANAGTAQVSGAIRTVAEADPEDPSERKTIVDFENHSIGAWTGFSTRGNSYPNVSIVADPANPGQKSLQVSVTDHNQAPIVPISLPYALEHYQTVSVRLRMAAGTITGQNFQVFASNSNAEAGNFVQWGFGNNSDQQHHFQSLRIARSAENAFSTATHSGWTTISMNLASGAATQNLVGNIFLAIGINTNTPATFLIDDITFTLKDSFVLPTLGAGVTTPVLDTKSARIITIQASTLTAPTGQSIEYGISTTDTAPSAWQDGHSFSNLTPDTDYYIFARSKAGVFDGTTYRAGQASAPLAVKTELEALSGPRAVGQGAAETGNYRNLLLEWGIASQQEIDDRIAQTWHRIFGCENNSCPITGCNQTATGTPAPHNHAFRLYYEVNNAGVIVTNGTGTKGYIVDAGNSDVRSEGMSYGLMMAVQMDRQDIFDKLWRWTYDHMYHGTNPSRRGYFAWQVGTNGNIMDSNSAPDGEIFFATALLFASNRWGDGAGVLEYGRYGRQILYDLINRDGLTGDHNRPLFCLDRKMPRMGPMGDQFNHTNYSYHLAHFFEIWAEEIEYGLDTYTGIWPSETAAMADAQFWREAAGVSREYFKNLINDPPKTNFPQHGLAPEYSNWDGSARAGTQGHVGLWVDAWRVAGIIAMDYEWWARDPWQIEHADTIQEFLARPANNTRPPGRSYGNFTYPSAYSLNGTPDTARAPDTSPGFVGNNAVASLTASNTELAREFALHFWNTGMTSGQWRYYDGCLYFFSLLSLSGNYRAYYSTGPGAGELNSRLTSSRAEFDKAGPADIPVGIRWNGNTLSNISRGSEPLTPGTHYTVTGEGVTLHTVYLQTLPLGSNTLVFTFSGGEIKTRSFTVSVDNTSIPILGHTFEQPVPVTFTGTGTMAASFPGGDVLRLHKTNTNNSTIGAVLPFRLLPGANLRDDHTTLYLEIRGVSGDLGSKTIIAEARAANDPFTGLGNSLVSQSQNFAAGTWYELAIPLAAGRPILSGDIAIAFGLNNTTEVIYEIRYIGLVPKDEVLTPSAGISPTTAGFDLADPQAIPVTVTWNGRTLTAIRNAGTALMADTDYTVAGDTVTINTAYLNTRTVGTTNLTFEFDEGSSRILTITVSNSAILDAVLDPASAGFDKAAPAAVSTTMTLNGNTFNGITGLTLNTHYTRSDDTITFNESYLMGLETGPHPLTFQFSPGVNRTFTIEIEDSTEPPPPTFKSWYTFDEDLNWAEIIRHNDLAGRVAHNNTRVTHRTAGVNGEANVLEFNVGATRDVFVIPFDIGTRNLSDYTHIRVRLAPGNANGQHKEFAVAAASPANSGAFDRIGESNMSQTSNIVIARSNPLNPNQIIRGANEWRTTDIPIIAGNAALGFTGVIDLAFGIPDHHNADAIIQISEIRLIGANSDISPNNATFNIDAPGSVTVTMTLRGNTLMNITRDGTPLVRNIDYTVSSDLVTFTDSYLVGLGIGNYPHVFVFNEGENRNFAITIMDNSGPPPPSPIVVPATGINTGFNVSFIQEAGGVRITQTNGHGNSYAVFDVVIPDGMSLSDYATATFTYTRVGGDSNSKNIRMLDLDGMSTLGWMNDDTNGGSSGTQGSAGVGHRVVTTAPQVGTLTEGVEQPVTLNILNNARTQGLTGTIRLAVYIHANNGAAYRISDITLTPRNG
jgi:endo-1,4-beta-D-glucanase Y